jgi:uncharacterized membrane protein YhaH (DUF805 family)
MQIHDDFSRTPWPEPAPEKPSRISFGQWYWRRGRINRRTYWLHYFLLLEIIGLLSLLVVPSGPGSDGTAALAVNFVIFLITLTPSLSSQVARLHDRGHSAWWLLWSLLPVVGSIVLIVQSCLKGEPRPNRYGPPPAPRNPVPDAPHPVSVP